MLGGAERPKEGNLNPNSNPNARHELESTLLYEENVLQVYADAHPELYPARIPAGMRKMCCKWCLMAQRAVKDCITRTLTRMLTTLPGYFAFLKMRAKWCWVARIPVKSVTLSQKPDRSPRIPVTLPGYSGSMKDVFSKECRVAQKALKRVTLTINLTLT